MNHKISRNIYRKLMINFGKTLSVYTVLMLICAFFFYDILSRKIWYPEDPFYPFLHWLHDRVILIAILAILFGGILICCVYFFRLARMMEEITNAVDTLYQGSSEQKIDLPELLKEVEIQLNQIMSTAKDNEKKMKELQRQKDDMIMYMAHDLKTPLTSVIGYLTLLNDEKEISESTRKHYYEIALNKANRLEDLINEFFEITKIGYSHIILSRTEINLARMLEQFLFEFQPIFEQKKLTYTLDSPSELIISCDTEQMQRVFDNLFKNVVNYSQRNTDVHVSLTVYEADSHYCLCQIINCGDTIPPEKLAHIFDQFYRVDSARGSSTGGTGLGLAIVKQIVKMHQGTITCESKNHKIIFQILLPITK